MDDITVKKLMTRLTSIENATDIIHGSIGELASIIYNLYLLSEEQGEPTNKEQSSDSKESDFIESINAISALTIESVNERQHEAPHLTDLNKNQRQVFNQLNEWFLHGDRECILSGAAGTGKTYLIAKFIKHLGVETLFLTPTHKAKKILAKALSSNDIYSEILTVAQGLGKQAIINNDGKEEFVKLTNNQFDNKDLIVVDESSMVGSEDFHGIRINTEAKILWVGDKYQLPPVKENVSAFFDSGLDVLELTQVVRYEGHILNECLALRNAIDTGIAYRPKSDNLTVVSVNKVKATLLASEMFKSSDFKADNTFCRFLGFRNAVVNNFNQAINQIVVPKHNPSKPYYLGQYLIANRPVSRLSVTHNDFGKKMTYSIAATACEEMVVISEPTECDILHADANGIMLNLRFAPELCQQIRGTITSFCCQTESGIKFDAIILHDDCQQSKRELFNQAKQKNDKQSMKFLYSLGDDLKDIWGITVHKSQGSTFKNVFLDVPDILKRSSLAKENEKDFRAEMLYTGFSRASEKVYLIE